MNFRESKKGGPASTLAAACYSVVMRHWEFLCERGDFSGVPSTDLARALEFLNHQSAAAYRVEFSRPRQPQQEERGGGGGDSWLFLALGLAALGALLYGVVWAMVKFPWVILVLVGYGALVKLAWKRTDVRKQPMDVAPWGSLVTLVFILVSLGAFAATGLARTWSDVIWMLPALLALVPAILVNPVGQLELAPAYGAEPWRVIPSRREVESQRLVLMNELFSESRRVAPDAVSREGATPSPPAPLSAVPAPPGITESVLSEADDDVFKDIRRHLLSQRRFHQTVLWIAFIAFMLFLGAGFVSFFRPLNLPGDYLRAFGMTTVGMVLFRFSHRALWAGRVSQLSLGLFNTLVAEARASLRELPDGTAETRRAARSEIWSCFREGVNKVWVAERDLMDREPGSARKEPKTTDAA